MSNRMMTVRNFSAILKPDPARFLYRRLYHSTGTGEGHTGGKSGTETGLLRTYTTGTDTQNGRGDDYDIITTAFREPANLAPEGGDPDPWVFFIGAFFHDMYDSGSSDKEISATG